MDDFPHERKLTGNYYFRPTLLGLVIHVEIERVYSDSEHTPIKEFVRATLSDLFELGFISATKFITT